MTDELHVVFGAGQVGGFLAERLLADGMPVRVVKRSAGGVPDGAETVLGDAGDASFCREATRGAHVVYHCMNPAYSTALWEELLPRYMDNLVAAAGDAGARLVVLDNLYALGPTGGAPISEATPPGPVSRKGEIRHRVSQALFEAHARGDVQAVVGRASDFYGPRGQLTQFGDFFWKAALAGKTARLLIDPDAVHTYHYIPDVAAGLAALGRASDDVTGQVWMLPCVPAETARDLVARFSQVLGRDIKVAEMPRLVMKVAGLFVPVLREFAEMRYQWDAPFVVDDSHFRAHFDVRPTDPDEAARATVAWAQQAYKA